MKIRSVKRVSDTLLFILLISFFTPLDFAHAATGDTDSYFNLEANTTSSHRYAIGAPNSAAHLANAFTWEIWLRPTNACSGIYCHIFAKENEYVLGVINGTYQFALNAASSWAWVDTTVPVKLNAWQHVAFSRAASTNVINMYLNGKLAYTGAAGHLGTSGFADTSYNFQIGARTSNVNDLNATPAQSYIGSLDELKFWKIVRSQSEIQSDMNSYGPTNDSNLQLYYDFNDASGSTLDNKASGATSASQLTLKNNPTYSRVDSTTVVSGNTITYLGRAYISANGYKLPVGTRSLSALIIGAGGGGGNNVGNGGSGGGGYLLTNYGVNSTTSFFYSIGMGGAGGKYASAGTLVYDGTYRMDGQPGETTTLTIGSNSFAGSGGGGGETIWSTNYCGTGTGAAVVSSIAGSGIGSGGTAYTGGLGGIRSSTQSVANGGSGFTSSITGTSTNYSGGGGSGGWSSYVQGTGANSIGGNGNGADGVDGTGSGGGGNAAGCAIGGYGSNGIVILSFAAYSGEISLPSSAVYRTSSSVIATVTAAGKVTFYEKGKVISACKNVPTVSSATITATCNWKPTAHGATSVSARFIATGGTAYPATIPETSLVVAKRTNSR